MTECVSCGKQLESVRFCPACKPDDLQSIRDAIAEADRYEGGLKRGSGAHMEALSRVAELAPALLARVDAAEQRLSELERKAWAYISNRTIPEFDVDWVDHLIQRAQVAGNDALAAEQRCKALEAEVAKAKDLHIDTIRESNDLMVRLRRELNAKDAELAEVDRKNDHLIANCNRLTGELSDAKAERDRLKAENAQLRADLKASEAKWEKLRPTVNDALQAQIRHLEATCPGEHEYEPNCRHGQDHDPACLALRSVMRSLDAGAGKEQG